MLRKIGTWIREALDPAEDAAPDDVARDGAHEEDERTAVRKPRPGMRRPKMCWIAGREEIVDGVPEHLQEPRRGDGGNGDEEAGDEPNLQPVAKPRRHNRQMRPHAPNQVKELAGTVALVTGGAVRVGRAIALALAEAGADVAIGYHRSSGGGARHRPRAVAARGVRAVASRADIGKPAEARAPRRQDGARASAGSTSSSTTPRSSSARPSLATTPAQFDRIIAVNLRGAFFCAQAAARAMGRRGGRIVNIADVGAVRAWPGYIPYGLSKAGIVMLTHGLAVALAPGIQVNAVGPGVVLLPEGFPRAAAKRLADRIPMGRQGEPADVAAAVRFFATCPEYITGQVLFVDGGAYRDLKPEEPARRRPSPIC